MALLLISLYASGQPGPFSKVYQPGSKLFVLTRSGLTLRSKPDIAGKIFFTKKNFHVGDINLFYINIRQNVRTRINAFLKK